MIKIPNNEYAIDKQLMKNLVQFIPRNVALLFKIFLR